MDKLTLQNYREQKLSIREISTLTSKSYTTIRYWLEKFQLDSIPNRSSGCLQCGKILKGRQINFCSKKCKATHGNKNHQSSQKQKQRGVDKKIKLINLKGGKCEKCNYNKNYAALQFHHINPEEKDSGLDLRKLSNCKWEWCLEEVKKCQLLCANCHAETHHPSFEREKLVVNAGSAPDASTDHALWERRNH